MPFKYRPTSYDYTFKITANPEAPQLPAYKYCTHIHNYTPNPLKPLYDAIYKLNLGDYLEVYPIVHNERFKLVQFAGCKSRTNEMLSTLIWSCKTRKIPLKLTVERIGTVDNFHIKITRKA